MTERFKPSISLPPAYVRLGNIWREPLPFKYRENECFFKIGGCQTFTRGAVLSYIWREKTVYFFAPEQGLCEFLEPELAGLDINALGKEFLNLFLETLREDICGIFLQFHETLKIRESHWSIQTIPNTLYFDWSNAEKNLYRLYIIEDGDNAAPQLMEKIHQKNGSTEGLSGNACMFPFRLLMGQARLTVEELKSLRVGDIILSQTPRDRVKFYCGKAVFFAEKKEQQFCVTGLLMEEENHDLPVGVMPDDDAELSELEGENAFADGSAEPEKAAFPMEQLPVVIAFEAGKKELTFEQLQQLHEGYTFELDQKPDEQVQILANGHCIGQGEWVQINDRLGVRITHLSLK